MSVLIENQFLVNWLIFPVTPGHARSRRENLWKVLQPTFLEAGCSFCCQTSSAKTREKCRCVAYILVVPKMRWNCIFGSRGTGSVTMVRSGHGSKPFWHIDPWPDPTKTAE